MQLIASAARAGWAEAWTSDRQFEILFRGRRSAASAWVDLVGEPLLGAMVPMSRMPFSLGLVAASILFATSVRAGETTAAAAASGNKPVDFTLNDFHGKAHSLVDYGDKPVVVIAFLGTECPLARVYAGRLAELQRKYAGVRVQFLGIDSNRQDSITEIAAFARNTKIGFPVLKDLNNKLADRLGALRTPEVFVLDQSRAVRYHGRVDDQFGVGFVRKSASAHELQSAIDALLAGRPVAKAETKVIGCLIGRVHAPDPAAKVTYCNQVVRILNKRCVSCHRQGEIAPFAMTNYDEVSGWADMIAEVVRQRRMPPWHADRKYGHFGNDRSLPDDEKEILCQWAASGAPEGDLKELPPPPRFVAGWRLPKVPDQVFSMAKKPYRVPAEGTVEYKYFPVDPGFTQDRWIKGMEARPGNAAVVHHIVIFSQKKGNRDELQRQLLAGYAPGAAPTIFPAGMAKFVPAGSELLFQMHYTPNGTEQEDISKVGFIYADPSEVTHLVEAVAAVNSGFAIPPGADDYKVEADSFSFNFDMQLISLAPHMHFRGKSFRYELKYPDGRTETLLDVPRYDFGWQTSYELANPKPLPKGTVFHCTALFDNSTNNPNNPDAKATVRWGDQTWEEMMVGFYDAAVPVSQSDIKARRFPSFIPSAEQMARSLIQQFDADHDGKISQREVPLKPLARKLFFVALDQNHDGMITTEEIISGIEKFGVVDRRPDAQRVSKR
jgi:peroxiredoxin